MITVIATTPKREMWLSNLLSSMDKTSVIILSDYSFELGKIKFIQENTKIEKFLFLQDSIIFKDVEKFYFDLSRFTGSVSINKSPTYYGSYMGIYERKILNKIKIPIIKNKEEAVYYEVAFNNKYAKLAKNKIPILYPDLNDSQNSGFELVNGRNNLKIENEVLIKYKGTWTTEQLDQNNWESIKNSSKFKKYFKHEKNVLQKKLIKYLNIK